FLDENCTVDAVKGNGYVMIGGTLRADYVEGAAVSLHYADFICTAKENIGFIFRVHNDNPDATRTFSASRTTIHCEKETFDLLKENTPEGDGLPAVKLDNPVRLNTMGLGDVKLTDELAFLFPDREGEELMFFGYGSSGTAPEAFDTYCIQYGKPVSVECKTSADIIKLYNKGDSFNYYFTWANVTWMSGNHRYTETYRGVTSLGYDFQSGIKIEGVDSADKITGEPLVMVWAPVDGVRLTSPVMDVKGYYLLEKTAEINRVYGTHKDEYCRVTFNETATAASGTVYEDQSSEKYRIEKGGSAVFTVDVAEGYEVHKVEAANCTVKQTGANEYTLSNIQGDTRISVRYDAHEYEHDVTMVNGAHGFVDLEETNLLTIGAEEGYYVQAVIVNGKDLGQVNKLRLTCDSKIVVVFSKIGETADISKYISSGNTESGTGSSSGTSVSKEKLIAGIKATTIKASTVNVVGTKIRVNWKKSAGYKVDYYQIFRSTKRNSGYGTKPIYTTKTGKATSYTNSKNLKVGTRYYYKVRGVRVIDGKKYYTKWSNKANRTARYTPQASGKY
ncbi:MAG: hypothetical protein IKT31_08095, partial [Firmicutes bacterium]|nr:hypothetical protein [Bacillota bacterium]